MIKLEGIQDFNLQHIFDCGQCFRWNRQEDGSYTGIAFGKPVNMQFVPESNNGFSGTLLIDNCSEAEAEEIWRPYLDLHRDYGSIKQALMDKDPVIGQAIASGQGIRILKQEVWETVISFIISQNSNIPRIKRGIETLAEQFGEPAGKYRGKPYFSIPTPQRLAALTAADLDVCRLGYRANYLIETAKRVEADGSRTLADLWQGSREDAFSYLVSLPGIGPKVANCILLFSVGKLESFPIDVWMRRVMNRLYGLEEKDLAGMERLAAENFGAYGGIAQQYLFYYVRDIS